jgi:hypothetical protein
MGTMVPNAISLPLNDDEFDALMQQDSSSRSEGGFQSLLARIFQCAVKSHGSPVGETKQTHPGTIRSARNHLEG